jgi:hypothetical protein
MHTKTTTVLAISVIVMAIALVTSSSLADSAIAVKKTKGKSTSSSTTGDTKSSSTTGGTSSSTTGVSKLVSCIRALPASFTRADVDNCYDTVFKTGGSTASSASGSFLGTPSSSGTP